MRFNFDKSKNEQLLKTRGIGFEEIITEIQLGNLVSVKTHHNFDKYPKQEIMFVKVCFVIYVVPYVIEDDGTFFLKTLYPSRKATKQHIENKL